MYGEDNVQIVSKGVPARKPTAPNEHVEICAVKGN